MASALLYAISVLAAAALYVLLRPGRRAVHGVAAIVGLGAVGWLIGSAPTALGDGTWRPEAFFVIFGLIAVASSVRMITHHKPVYSALYFILVVLASAALFLLLEAEFMAFALIIVYAGAILITYVFVLMLAQQSATADDESGEPEYDRVPREPAAAALVGFVMLALLAGVILGPGVRPAPAAPSAAAVEAWHELETIPGRFRAVVLEAEPAFNWPPAAARTGELVRVGPDGEGWVEGTVGDGTAIVRVDLPASARPENVQSVGLALVARFPVSLELAGVILLMAMFGAVVLARRQIEIGEDEMREAAGLEPIVPMEEPPGPEGGAA